MGIFLTLNNIDRFPGLVMRVKGAGDEIEISHQSQGEPKETECADATHSGASVDVPVTVCFSPDMSQEDAVKAVNEALSGSLKAGARWSLPSGKTHHRRLDHVPPSCSSCGSGRHEPS